MTRVELIQVQKAKEVNKYRKVLTKSIQQYIEGLFKVKIASSDDESESYSNTTYYQNSEIIDYIGYVHTKRAKF